ncbi:YdeI family protein [Dyadobacter sp. CY323]|uniref:YdeI/OmpD-associated family protein n=1 Tax=Dyadobacter sp. CY323 TaxID=2907302 RepID=UPI001F1687B4|nr:YdeI/OmpD-associated family protein [Dyadobacter sp. CY323]MCE6990915.1 YdeI/OmpD-associated family protein [Dyadobacter sp. CY323]
MQHTDPRVDTYILKSADFAIPILEYLRAVIHNACPEVKETMKWSFPNFDYHGSIMCNMASFKGHCSFGFWLASQLTDPHNVLTTGDEKNAMGQLGKIKSLDDLPSEEYLTGLVKEAMHLIDSGVKQKRSEKSAEPKELAIPDYVPEALSKSPKAQETFAKFSYSNKKDYIEWFEEAKTEATRNKRVATAIEWMEEGKSRNWKYERK